MNNKVYIGHGGRTFWVKPEYLAEALSILHDVYAVRDGRRLSYVIDCSFVFHETAEGYDFWQQEYERARSGHALTPKAERLLAEYLRLAEDADVDEAGKSAPVAAEPCDPNDLTVFDLGGA